MRPTFVTFLRDAWHLWRADWNVLIGIAGLFVFLPLLALGLLVEPQMARATQGIDPADSQRMVEASIGALRANLPWIVVAQTIAQFGALTIMFSYLDRARPDVRGALGRALLCLPWYALAMMLASFIALPGILLLIVGYFYLFARLSLIGPVMAAEQQSNPFAAIGRSFALTRGHGFAITGAVMMVLLFGYVAGTPFTSVSQWMVTNLPNPILLAVVGAFGAATTGFASLALALVQVAAYRRLSSS